MAYNTDLDLKFIVKLIFLILKVIEIQHKY
jgi:hypothetical protein